MHDHLPAAIPVQPEDRGAARHILATKIIRRLLSPLWPQVHPLHLQQIAEALEWILREQGIQHIIHYLHDFLIAGNPGSSDCEQALTHTLHICRQLGFPIAEGKTEGSVTILVFLGILLDTVKLEMHLPEDKLPALKALLQQWQTIKKTTKRELLSLIGSLSFAAKVIPAGRIFLRRLIDLSTSVPKLHHCVKLNASARADIQWWLDFLPSLNGVSLMLQFTWEDTAALDLCTNAAGTLGFGAYFQGAWMMGTRSPCMPTGALHTVERVICHCSRSSHLGVKRQIRKIRVYCDNL